MVIHYDSIEQDEWTHEPNITPQGGAIVFCISIYIASFLLAAHFIRFNANYSQRGRGGVPLNIGRLE